MDHDRIHRILELNQELTKTNAELINAIKGRAKPDAIQGIREAIKGIRAQIEEMKATETDN